MAKKINSKSPAKKVVKKVIKTTTLKTKTALKKPDVTAEEFMKACQHPFKQEIETLRNIIKQANKKISERVKWNAPSYFYIKDMAAFNLHQQKFVQLIFIFPYGLIPENDLLKGNWKDRREARFYDMNDIKAKKAVLEKTVKEWVTLTESNN